LPAPEMVFGVRAAGQTPGVPPLRAVGLLLAVLVLVAPACSGSDDDGASGTQTVATPTTTESSTVGGVEPRSGDVFGRIPAIVEEVQPSVVSIAVQGPEGGGEGSGVIWDGEGTIVTNHHVVDGAQEVAVVLASGDRLPAEVRASSEDFDLAVLEVERQGLPAARFADELPAVGELAVAIGNPLGFENTVTAGIVSGVHRSIPSGGRAPALVDLIQTDAPISPGNSGGALVSADGEVIGINVAYIPPSDTGAVSLGFAIPSTTAREVVEQLLESGEVELAYLGVRPVQVTSELAEQFDLNIDEGVSVEFVEEDSAAEQAGMEGGDVIVELGGEEIRTVEDLFAQLRQRRPGEQVDVTVVRDGERRQLRATLDERPAG